MHTIETFIAFASLHNGIGNKAKFTKLAVQEFDLVEERSVFYCKNFAVRFSYSSNSSFSNTVLSLSKLKQYDHIPFIVCLVTKGDNKLFLANSTFLEKISHSSQTLSLTNIKGSFNGSDISTNFNGIENTAKNFEQLFAMHYETGFEGNLARLVQATNNISATGHKFEINATIKSKIENSIDFAIEFASSKEFSFLKTDLDARVRQHTNAILAASQLDNVNIRGRIIEYLITESNNSFKANLTSLLKIQDSVLPAFKTENSLGDYFTKVGKVNITTDIKTKITSLTSNPKAYNIDKFLEFHSKPNSVFLFYFIGIEKNAIFNTILVPVFQTQLLNSTMLIKHWAGRNSRGVAQFEGNTIHQLLLKPSKSIDKTKAMNFIKGLYEL
jgi:hypothetical protein